MDVKHWTYVVGLVLGAVLLLSVCFVWVRHQKYGTGGAGFSLVGVMLVGLSIWSSVKFEVGDWKAEFETLQQQVQEVAEAGATISEEVAKVAESANGSRQEMLTLTQTLEQRQVVTRPQAQVLQQNLNRLPAPKPEDLRLLSRRLSSDRFRRPGP